MRSTVLKPLSADSVLVDFNIRVPQRVITALEEAGQPIGIGASESAAQALVWFTEDAKCGRRIIKLGGMTRTRRKKAAPVAPVKNVTKPASAKKKVATKAAKGPKKR